MTGQSLEAIEIRDILRLLPHRYPFVMVDRIIEINGDESGIGIKNVTINEPQFQGHFPENPIMPGVLLIETMAQASGWLLIAMTKFQRMPFLAAVKEAKMRSFVSPGDLLRIEAGIVHEGSGFAMTSAKVLVGGELRCNATITFGIVPFPHPDLREHMDAEARRIGFPQQAVAND